MYNAVRLVRVLVGFHGANSAKCEEATHVLPTKVISYFRIYTEVPKGRAVGTKVRKYFRTKVLPYENINTKVRKYGSTFVRKYFRTDTSVHVRVRLCTAPLILINRTVNLVGGHDIDLGHFGELSYGRGAR